MRTIAPDNLLRRVLRLDACASGASGVLLIVAAAVLADTFAAELGIPGRLLAPLGVVLVGYAIGLWFIETRPSLNRSAVQAVIVVNALWVAASVLTVLLARLPLTGAGTAFVLLQAAAVALIAERELTGLRQVSASQTYPGATLRP